MSEMRVNNLNVDLIQDQAAISLFKQPTQMSSGKSTFTSVNINVPLASPGDDRETDLRRKAILQAKEALKEAIEVLEAYPT